MNYKIYVESTEWGYLNVKADNEAQALEKADEELANGNINWIDQTGASTEFSTRIANQ